MLDSYNKNKDSALIIYLRSKSLTKALNVISAAYDLNLALDNARSNVAESLYLPF
jgi:hypothetical protein